MKKYLFLLLMAAMAMVGCKKADMNNELMMLVGTYTYDGSYGIYIGL